MLLNEETGELFIKISRGIKKDIIKNTRLKIGEGIAGLAAQEERFYCLMIKSRMNESKDGFSGGDTISGRGSNPDRG